MINKKIYNHFSNFLKSFLYFFKHKIKWFIFSAGLPANFCRDDLFLVSFPKSGITWLSFLMANIHIQMSGARHKVTFFNIEDFIPDINQSIYINSSPPLSFPGYRVIKSHSEFNPFYKKVFYLIRDPRDVMVSYYIFLKFYIGSYQGTLHNFIKSSKLGIKAWCRHVQSWARTPHGTRIWFIRFEDLKKDPKGSLELLYRHLGYEIPVNILNNAIEKASLTNMKELEKFHNSGWGAFRYSEVSFVRKGEVGGYKSEMSKVDEEFIIDKAGYWMKKFGYLK